MSPQTLVNLYQNKSGFAMMVLDVAEFKKCRYRLV